MTTILCTKKKLHFEINWYIKINVKIAKNASAKHIDMIGNYYFSVVCLLPIDFSQSLAEISSVAVPVDQNRRKVPLSLPG